MQALPAFHQVAGKKVLILGGGAEAAQKLRLAAAAGAQVTAAAPRFEPAIAEWRGRAELIEGDIADEVFRGAALAFIAVDSEADARALAARARAAGVPVNVVDRPALSDFLTPAIIDRGDIVVAISTGGAAPALARRLRAKIEALLPQRLADVARFARGFRAAVAARVADRRRFWDRFFDGPIAERVLAGDDSGAREAMIKAINRGGEAGGRGVVHLVGAGPGDPELLTLKALRLLQTADVILYDRLVGERILDLARRDAVRLYVGKARGAHAVPQEEIGARLVALAREGKIVVRLKGGDPLIFGRGGEELEALRAAGVAAYVTPGVTAASAGAAAAGVPLTHRDAAQSVTFLTGAAKQGGLPDFDWPALARPGQTLVVYMGVGAGPAIAERLMAHGAAPETPAAIVEKAASPDQRIFRGALVDLAPLIVNARIEGPAVIIIGAVAAKADGLSLTALAALERRAA